MAFVRLPGLSLDADHAGGQPRDSYLPEIFSACSANCIERFEGNLGYLTCWKVLSVSTVAGGLTTARKDMHPSGLDAHRRAVLCHGRSSEPQDESCPMQRCWIRLILLLVVAGMQTGCLCWSNCPQPEKSAVEWHTPPYGSNGE